MPPSEIAGLVLLYVAVSVSVGMLIGRWLAHCDRQLPAKLEGDTPTPQ